MLRFVLFAALLVAALLIARGGGAGLRQWLRRRGRQVLIGIAALAYLLSPIDLVPDVAPPGILDDILVLLAAWWWATSGTQAPHGRGNRDRRAAGSSAERGREEKERWDPYAVLGVAPGASREEIARAYRAQMKRYHPDRVADLGPELQDLAHRKTVEIQRAWNALCGS